MLKKVISIFVLAFVLNWAWETLHSALYLSYQGGHVTSFILFRAALVDAAIILILVLFSQKLPFNKSWFVVAGGLIIAIIIEVWAMQTGRWAYNALMPIIPIIKVGLTPVIQLAITGYVTQKIVFKNFPGIIRL